MVPDVDRRRLAGVGVLASAVLALAVGAGLNRPLSPGSAQAAPVDRPPQIGDCLYADSAGPWVMRDDGGNYDDRPHSRWYEPCLDPWFGEVVGVRTQADIQKDLSENRVGPDFDPCTALTAAYLGRPDVSAVAGWAPVATSATALDPDLRQQASGQRWQACVVPPLAVGPGGTPTTGGFAQGGPRTTETLRGRWQEPDFRNRLGSCSSGPPDATTLVFCGDPHDRETLARGWWDEPTAAVVLLQGCARQAALVMQRDQDETLAIEVQVDNGGDDSEILTIDSPMNAYGAAICSIRAANHDQQLTATVIDLGDRPVPIIGGG